MKSISILMIHYVYQLRVVLKNTKNFSSVLCYRVTIIFHRIVGPFHVSRFKDLISDLPFKFRQNSEFVLLLSLYSYILLGKIMHGINVGIKVRLIEREIVALGTIVNNDWASVCALRGLDS